MFIRTDLLKPISFRNPVKLPLSYWILVGLRFLLTILPQRGYIHPDEFFQNVEVIAGDILNVDVARTWEFSPKSPIRNIFIPKIILGPPLLLISIANSHTKHYINVDLKTPYYLLVIPRIFICLLSLINDYCLYRICVIYGQNFRNRLTIFASSYVVLVYCCRSFSNTFEMIFFSILLLAVAECMFKSDNIIYHSEILKEIHDKAANAVEKVKVFKLTTYLPAHSFNRVSFIATIVVMGIFNRPTFAGFAFPPVFFWFQRGLGSKTVGFKDFHFRIFLFILCCVPPTLFLIFFDSVYYGYLTNADIESLKLSWDNWVVTPLNFLRYNSDPKNLIDHGLHPRWFHVAINMPLLFNVLGGLAFITLSTNVYRFIRGQYNKLPRIQSITGLMLSSFIVPLVLLSLFPHQEPRFIIPVLVPLVYLYGNNLYTNDSDTTSKRKLKIMLKSIWYILNVLFTIFYGFVHQGGIYPLAETLHREIKSNYGMHTHVIITHSYSLPTYLLQLESTTRIWRDRNTGQKYTLAPSTFIHRFGSLPVKDLFVKIERDLYNAENLLHRNKKQYRFYVVSPCSLDEQIRSEASKYGNFDLIEVFSFYPHFCSEALPIFPSNRDQFCVGSDILNTKQSNAIDLNLFDRLICFLKRFCLKVYRVKSYTSYKR